MVSELERTKSGNEDQDQQEWGHITGSPAAIARRHNRSEVERERERRGSSAEVKAEKGWFQKATWGEQQAWEMGNLLNE